MENFLQGIDLVPSITDDTTYVAFLKKLLSQWYKHEFYYMTIDFGHIPNKRIKFNCTEQAMMYSKAALFNDTESMDLIMQTSSLKEQQALGRKVKNFDQEIWDREKFRIVRDITHQKFNQLPEVRSLFDHLNNAYGIKVEFVEASPIDRVWGIGTDDLNDVADKNKWQGQNLLGKAWTDVYRFYVRMNEELKPKIIGHVNLDN